MTTKKKTRTGMSEQQEQAIIDMFHARGRAHGGEIPVRGSREAMIEPIAAMLAENPRDLDAEAGRIFDQLIDRGERKRQAHYLRKDLDWIIEGVADPEQSPGIELYLSLLFPLGDGTDKVLANWTREDYVRVVAVREQGADEQVHAAQEFRSSVTRVINFLDANGFSTLGEAVQ